MMSGSTLGGVDIKMFGVSCGFLVCGGFDCVMIVGSHQKGVQNLALLFSMKSAYSPHS